jgi:REP element-mobilizing transposase RayT
MPLFRDVYRIESARHPTWDYSLPGMYFVTIRTSEHRCHFGRIRGIEMKVSEIGKAAIQEWRQIPSHHRNVQLDEFIVMPNHVHGVVTIRDRSVDQQRFSSLGTIVGCYKAGVTRWAHEHAHLGFGWQARFYDHIIRGDRSLAAVREYISANPENWFHDEFYRAA